MLEVKEQNLYADVSYTLNLGGESRLAFGVKAGATFHNVSLLDDVFTRVPDANDPAFQFNVNNTYFNAGTGLFYYTDKFYFAASVPNMIKSVHLDNGGRKFGVESPHYFFTSGYVFDLTDNIKFKPFAMVKTAFNAVEIVEIVGVVSAKDSVGDMICQLDDA